MENEQGADAPDLDMDADASAPHSDSDSGESVEELRERLARAEAKARETIESRQKAKERGRTLENENQDLKRRLEAIEREKLEKQGKYQEALERVTTERAEFAAEREAYQRKISEQLYEKKFQDLYNRVLEKEGLDPANQFVIEAALKRIADERMLIPEVDVSDIESLSISPVPKESVDAASRQLRKFAPALFNKAQAEGGDVSSAATENKATVKGLPPGIDPNDPEVQRVMRAARGR